MANENRAKNDNDGASPNNSKSADPNNSTSSSHVVQQPGSNGRLSNTSHQLPLFANFQHQPPNQISVIPQHPSTTAAASSILSQQLVGQNFSSANSVNVNNLLLSQARSAQQAQVSASHSQVSHSQLPGFQNAIPQQAYLEHQSNYPHNLTALAYAAAANMFQQQHQHQQQQIININSGLHATKAQSQVHHVDPHQSQTPGTIHPQILPPGYHQLLSPHQQAVTAASLQVVPHFNLQYMQHQKPNQPPQQHTQQHSSPQYIPAASLQHHRWGNTLLSLPDSAPISEISHSSTDPNANNDNAKKEGNPSLPGNTSTFSAQTASNFTSTSSKGNTDLSTPKQTSQSGAHNSTATTEVAAIENVSQISRSLLSQEQHQEQPKSTDNSQDIKKETAQEQHQDKRLDSTIKQMRRAMNSDESSNSKMDDYTGADDDDIEENGCNGSEISASADASGTDPTRPSSARTDTYTNNEDSSNRPGGDGGRREETMKSKRQRAREMNRVHSRNSRQRKKDAISKMKEDYTHLQMYKIIIDAMADMVSLHDLSDDAKIHFANPSFLATFAIRPPPTQSSSDGTAPSAVIPSNFVQLVHESDTDALVECLRLVRHDFTQAPILTLRVVAHGSTPPAADGSHLYTLVQARIQACAGVGTLIIVTRPLGGDGDYSSAISAGPTAGGIGLPNYPGMTTNRTIQGTATALSSSSSAQASGVVGNNIFYGISGGQTAIGPTGFVPLVPSSTTSQGRGSSSGGQPNTEK